MEIALPAEGAELPAAIDVPEEDVRGEKEKTPKRRREDDEACRYRCRLVREATLILINCHLFTPSPLLL